MNKILNILFGLMEIAIGVAIRIAACYCMMTAILHIIHQYSVYIISLALVCLTSAGTLSAVIRTRFKSCQHTKKQNRSNLIGGIGAFSNFY